MSKLLKINTWLEDKRYWLHEQYVELHRAPESHRLPKYSAYEIVKRKTLYDSIRGLRKYRSWRDKVRVRDNYTCCDCNSFTGTPDVHHIKPFLMILNEYEINTINDALICEELWDLENGKTLCKNCHHRQKRKMLS